MGYSWLVWVGFEICDFFEEVADLIDRFLDTRESNFNLSGSILMNPRGIPQHFSRALQPPATFLMIPVVC
jgi:hypothetical protein